MSRRTQPHQRATVGIITALPKEFTAVEVMLQSPIVWQAGGDGAGRRYLLGEIPAANSGTHVVALALLTDVGTNSAAVRANNLLHHFPSVRHIIMCGIAGGIPSPASPEDDIRLGDIVVSNREGIVNYDFIKQTTDEIQERHPPLPPGAELLEAVRFLETKRLKFQRPWELFLDQANKLEDAARPRDNQGADGKPINYPQDPKRRPGLPRLFYGPIASANRLLKDDRFRDELRRRFRTKAVEMEGSGVADAAWLSDRAGYLVVRGICDFCDMRKGDVWQGYAAVAAAAYVRALLESMPASTVHAEPADVPYPPQQHHFSPEQRSPSQPDPNDSRSSDEHQSPQNPTQQTVTSASHPSTGATGAKPKRSTSRPSASGRLIFPLLLIVGGVGLMTFPSEFADLGNTLKTLLGDLTSSPPQSPFLPTAPSPSLQMSSEGLSGLRRVNRVRAIQDSENGQILENAAGGVYGYADPQSLQYLSKARVYGTRMIGALEVHKLASGSLMIVGFVRDSDVRFISQARPARLSLLLTTSPDARTAVAIPMEWIRSFYLRPPGELSLEFFAPSASPKR